MDQDFSGSCTATSHNPLIQRGATTATKSEPFRPQRGAPGSIVKDLPLRREAACYRELPRIHLLRRWMNSSGQDSSSIHSGLLLCLVGKSTRGASSWRHERRTSDETKRVMGSVRGTARRRRGS